MVGFHSRHWITNQLILNSLKGKIIQGGSGPIRVPCKGGLAFPEVRDWKPESSAGLKEANSMLWRRKHGREWWEASRSWVSDLQLQGMQFYLKALSLEEELSSEWGSNPGWHLNAVWWDPGQKTQSACVQIPTHGNCEIISLYCFKLIKLWQCVT